MLDLLDLVIDVTWAFDELKDTRRSSDESIEWSVRAPTSKILLRLMKVLSSYIRKEQTEVSSSSTPRSVLKIHECVIKECLLKLRSILNKIIKKIENYFCTFKCQIYIVSSFTTHPFYFDLILQTD